MTETSVEVLELKKKVKYLESAIAERSQELIVMKGNVADLNEQLYTSFKKIKSLLERENEN
tara:strand:+ start:124 stop:306 length:183 start_codon:yes stop_codon:yes gene_type:complete